MSEEVKQAILNYPEAWTTKEVRCTLYAETGISVTDEQVRRVRFYFSKVEGRN